MPEPDADPGTTTALDTLCALFPDRPRSDLSTYLASSHGNLDRAFRAIEARQSIVHGSSGPHKRARTPARGGLDAWIRPARTESEVLVLSDSDDDDGGPVRGDEQTSKKPRKEPSKSAFDVLRSAPAAASSPSSTSTSSAPPPAPAYISLPPLVLPSPALVAQHTRGLVTLVEDALPPELAARLFARCVSESRGEGPGGEGPCASDRPFHSAAPCPILPPGRLLPWPSLISLEHPPPTRAPPPLSARPD